MEGPALEQSPVWVAAQSPEFAYLIAPVHLAVEHALSREGAPAGAGVSVMLVGDSEIADHHERFMAIPGPTDVISWPASQPEPAAPYLGDIMVSYETAARQAEELGHSLVREVQVLAVHGTLHLLGWDDQAPDEREAMQQRVDRIVDSCPGHAG